MGASVAVPERSVHQFTVKVTFVFSLNIVSLIILINYCFDRIAPART